MPLIIAAKGSMSSFARCATCGRMLVVDGCAFMVATRRPFQCAHCIETNVLCCTTPRGGGNGGSGAYVLGAGMQNANLVTASEIGIYPCARGMISCDWEQLGVYRCECINLNGGAGPSMLWLVLLVNMYESMTNFLFWYMHEAGLPPWVRSDGHGNDFLQVA